MVLMTFASTPPMKMFLPMVHYSKPIILLSNQLHWSVLECKGTFFFNSFFGFPPVSRAEMAAHVFDGLVESVRMENLLQMTGKVEAIALLQSVEQTLPLGLLLWLILK